jgi:ATP-binding cassette subfamily B protein
MRDAVDLLILDEPSAGADPEAEHRIHRTLREHGLGCTRILISHRLSALRDADAIVVLDNGRVAEHGTHDQLMSDASRYRQLFSLQASAYQDRRVAAKGDG